VLEVKWVDTRKNRVNLPVPYTQASKCVLAKDKNTDKKEYPYLDRNELGEDWVNWIPIPVKPEWLNKQIMRECRENHIPVTMLRVKERDGKEYIRLFRKSPLHKTEWIT
jgi:hypothetical protein